MKIISVFAFFIFSNLVYPFQSNLPNITPTSQQFRESIYHYLVSPQQNALKPYDNSIQNTDWNIKTNVYEKGLKVSSSHFHGSRLANVLNKIKSNLNIRPDNNPNYVVNFYYYPQQAFSFLANSTGVFELTGITAAIRKLTSKQITQSISLGQKYLLTHLNPKFNGIYKFYDPIYNTHGVKLRTIYSASTLFTLLNIQAKTPSPEIENEIPKIAKFLLSMQVKGGPNAGAFYYSVNPHTQKHDNIVNVGTTSKTIFTLIKLYEKTHDPRYLTAAKWAGNWLLTRIQPNGTVKALSAYTKNGWHDNNKQSHLYRGQVLSALSRLYRLTEEPRYLSNALIIASSFHDEIQKKSLPLSDDYRYEHPVGTSWVLMSLMDAYDAKPNKQIHQDINHILNYFYHSQITNKADIKNYGRFQETTTPSGNGWINEVLGRHLVFCQEHNFKECAQDINVMLKTSRWLIQNSYIPVNTYFVPNPKRALGGYINHPFYPKIRTDAVCHGVNSFIYLLEFLKPDSDITILLNIPEKPLSEFLSDIRMGYRLD